LRTRKTALKIVATPGYQSEGDQVVSATASAVPSGPCKRKCEIRAQQHAHDTWSQAQMREIAAAHKPFFGSGLCQQGEQIDAARHDPRRRRD
jgi:hypothetical protein